MPVTVSTSEGVTVLTLTSDPNSFCPPLCQILKGLCCSPRCCTLSQQLKENQGTSQSILGTLHIMVGLLNIGFSTILCVSHGATWDIRETYFPFWFGGMFISLGALCILSERCPSPGLVILNMTLNIVGFAFAVASIVLYSKNIADMWLSGDCYDDYGDKSPWQKLFKEKCLEKAALTTVLLKGINSLLIILSVMEVCVAISSVVLGFKAFGDNSGTEEKSCEDPEQHTPLLADDTDDPSP